MTSAAADLSRFLSTSFAGDEPRGVNSFGDRAGEVEALRESAGMVFRPDERAYHVGGGDRVTFLQRLLTADIGAIDVGSCRTSLLLDNKGRAHLALEVGATAKQVVGIGPAPAMDLGMETLSRYVLGADVQIGPLGGAVIAVIGPAADATVAAAGIDALEDPPMAFRARWGWFLVAMTPVAVWERLTAAGAVAAGLEAAERVRIARGLPRAGSEITGNEFPQELRLEAAVDFDKGCYLGQETVARIHYRGHVNRLLSVLRCDDELKVGESLSAGGENVGRITSVARAADGDTIALGLVARAHSGPGTRLAAGSGARVTVVEATG